MFFKGEVLVCVNSFSFFIKGAKYYCTHVTDGHFFISNNFTNYNVSTIKVPLRLSKNFKIKTQGV